MKRSFLGIAGSWSARTALGPLGCTAVAAAGCLLLGTGGGVTTPPATRPVAAVRPAPIPLPGGPRGGVSGPSSMGDPYFPHEGDDGYHATGYRIDLRYRPTDGSIDATVTISATALRDLSSFELDFRGPKVLSITVDGHPAAYRRTGLKLVVTPAGALRKEAGFTAVVHYAGVPSPVTGPGGGGGYGWIPTRDGAVVLSEPDGAPTWLPVNDRPSDKAIYSFQITVPKDLQVLANGEPDPPVPAGTETTYTWHERLPMASYLAMIAIGHFRIMRGMAGKIPVITAVDPGFADFARRLYRTTAAAVTWESSVFGQYPFATVGGIVASPQLGYALETQERPVYGGFEPDDDTIVHELAHQWFGDSVSLRSWPDIWLNEGFATYAEWLWHEHSGKESARKTFERYYRQPSSSPIFNPPPAHPGRGQLFATSVYIRGAMCLQALRDRVGSPAFFRILREWAGRYRYGSAATAQFEALAEQISHQRLGSLFGAWLDADGKPEHW